jgi:chromosome segregation ATPase
VIWALAIAGCAIVVAWERPKKPVAATISGTAERLRTEDIKSFVDLYEEKRKVVQESESLETMVQKGRIPRRRYKVRKKTLEIRLSTLSRSLAELTEKMNAAGGKYGDLMRQLEVAETEINEVEAGIKSITARHGRGEISLETYRKLLTDYRHREERTESTISGILLRLREEIH